MLKNDKKESNEEGIITSLPALAAAGMITACICIILLVSTACIPRKTIQKNSERSAAYFSSKEPFSVLIGNRINSIQDNFSDTVLCDIIYCFDSRHPLKSVIEAKYMQGEHTEVYEGYLEAVNGQVKTDSEYGRYWHGTSVILRPLLMFISIAEIRILFGTAIAVMQILVVILLIKRGKASFACCYMTGLLLIQPWMFFTSLEYSTAFIIASACQLFVLAASGQSEKWVMPFFLSTGVVTCFMDFLTTETVTYTLPMLLLFITRRDEGEKQNNAAESEIYGLRPNTELLIKAGFSWMAGYIGMFVLKMTLLFIISGQEVMLGSLKEGMSRVNGEVWQSNIVGDGQVDIFGRLSGAVWHNLSCLYYACADNMKAVSAWGISFFIIAAAFVFIYLFHNVIQWQLFVPLFMLALVPYMRFLVLSNHSYIHFFITYRALMVSVVVLVYFVYENGIKPLAISCGMKIHR